MSSTLASAKVHPLLTTRCSEFSSSAHRSNNGTLSGRKSSTGIRLRSLSTEFTSNVDLGCQASHCSAPRPKVFIGRPQLPSPQRSRFRISANPDDSDRRFIEGRSGGDDRDGYNADNRAGGRSDPSWGVGGLLNPLGWFGGGGGGANGDFGEFEGPMDVVEGRSRTTKRFRGAPRDPGPAFEEEESSWFRNLVGDNNFDDSFAGFFLRLGLTLVVTPILISTTLKIFVVNPILETELQERKWFSISAFQEEEVAQKVERTRQRIEYNVLMGRSPPLSGEEFLDTLRKEGQHLEEEEMHENKQAVSNIIADSISASVLAVSIVVNNRRVRLLQQFLGKKFLDMEASSQAFSLLLVADLLVGYHSSDGWITAISLVGDHYGWKDNETFTSLFVALVPVTLDVIFKYWVFKSLRKIAPSTQIILSEIEE